MKKQISLYLDEDLIKKIKHKALDLNVSMSIYFEKLAKKDLGIKDKKEN